MSQSIYAYWKGTPCPICCGEKKESWNWEKHANDYIIEMLRAGAKIPQLINTWTEEMNDMEEKLCKITNGKEWNKKMLKKWLSTLNLDEDEVMIKWYLNVFALLKLKAIKNDNEYGVLRVSGHLDNILRHFQS